MDVTAAQGRNRIEITGLSNLRDFGGYATGDGAVIPAGRLFRSAHLGRVPTAAAPALAALGLRTIIDLRGREERLKNAPDPAVLGGIAVVPAPVEPGSFTSMIAPDGSAITADMNRERILWVYRRFAGDAAAQMGAALVRVYEAAEAPLLIHCTAGKDRTGFVAATLLRLLGVPEDTVLADYHLTNDHWDRDYSGNAIFPPEVVAPLLLAHADYLGAAFAEIDRVDGSLAAYADRVTGLPDFAARLRDRILG